MAGKVGAKRKVLEREFEDLLIDVLEQDYDLSVRHAEDKIERRTRGVARLCFDYRYASATDAKAIVRIDGKPDFKAMLPVDFASREDLRRSAEDCEALVLFLSEHLEEHREKAMLEATSGSGRWGRREDD